MRRAGEPIPEHVGAVARPTVDAGVAACLEQLEREAGQHREQYVRRHREDLKLYVLPKTPEEVAAGRWQPPWRYLDEVTSAEWEREKLRLHRSARPAGPLGWRSIAHLTGSLRKMMRVAVAEGLIESVPELKPPPHKLVREEAAKRRALSEPERERFLKVIAERFPRSHRFYTVLFFTLFRRGELFALAPGWLDFRRKTILVPAEHSKSREAEEVHMHPRAAAALRAELASRGKVDRDAPLFGKHDARPAYRYALETARPRIDPRGLVPHHMTRHTGATMVGESTTDLLEIMAAMRVRSPAIAQRYLHVDARRARRVMARL